MKVFISWSEDRSKKIAELFSEWLPQVIQAIDPWISMDITKGARWSPEISNELEVSKIGIICLTPENLDNKWILFEAGALSKIKENKVCTFLLGLTPSDIEQPLGQFQHTIFTKDDVFKLIQSINNQLQSANEKSLPNTFLYHIFERSWPEFNEKMTEISRANPEKQKKHRSERDILEEILELIRKIDRQENQIINTFNFIPENINDVVENKYLRLTREFGIEPSDAIRSIINEMNKSYNVNNETRNLIFEHLVKISKNSKNK